VRGVTKDGRTETGSVGVMPSKLRLQNGPGYCSSVWCSVAEVRFSPVQTAGGNHFYDKSKVFAT
jgi:hypothetical protein